MALKEEIEHARQQVVTDGYDMSLGEIINLYKDNELVIDPVFQRLFRWEDDRKTRFIESLILGIPIPPIFVSMDDNGVWELVDGLQRLSTVLQLTGDLRGEKAAELGPLILNGTRFLPSLNGMRWPSDTSTDENTLDKSIQLELKRSRLRVEILKAESDTTAKFELFQRLNTGGAGLTPQEVRNSIAVQINREFHEWLTLCASNDDFVVTTNQTDTALESQAGVELALRFFAFRNVDYVAGLDVHEYLDDALFQLASNSDFDRDAEKAVFDSTFLFLRQALEDKAFKRWNGATFSGKFLMSVFEVLATGTSHNVAALEQMDGETRSKFIRDRAKDLWENETFAANSGAGVRGTTRLARLLPIASDIMKPA